MSVQAAAAPLQADIPQPRGHYLIKYSGLFLGTAYSLCTFTNPLVSIASMCGNVYCLRSIEPLNYGAEGTLKNRTCKTITLVLIQTIAFLAYRSLGMFVSPPATFLYLAFSGALLAKSCIDLHQVYKATRLVVNTP